MTAYTEADTVRYACKTFAYPEDEDPGPNNISIVHSTLEALDADGRLLPAPVKVRVEWAVWCHGEDRNGIRLDEWNLGSRERAAAWGDEQIGRYGITGYRIMRREHHHFGDGAPYAVAVTDWVDDPEPDPAGYRWVCPGVGERGRGLTATIVHGSVCCDRFAALTPAEQEKTGLRIPTGVTTTGGAP